MAKVAIIGSFFLSFLSLSSFPRLSFMYICSMMHFVCNFVCLSVMYSSQMEEINV